METDHLVLEMFVDKVAASNIQLLWHLDNLCRSIIRRLKQPVVSSMATRLLSCLCHRFMRKEKVVGNGAT